MLLPLLLLLLLFIVAGFALFAVSRLSAIAKSEEELRSREENLRGELGDMVRTCAEYQRRFTVVHGLATDYVNSLRADTSKTFLQLTELFNQETRTAGKVQSLLDHHTIESCEKAELLLREQLLPGGEQHPRQPGSGEAKQCRWRFETSAEDLLQRVGRDVYEAAEKTKHLRLPARRDRKPAAQSLVEDAGIRLDSAEEAGPDAEEP